MDGGEILPGAPNSLSQYPVIEPMNCSQTHVPKAPGKATIRMPACLFGSLCVRVVKDHVL